MKFRDAGRRILLYEGMGFGAILLVSWLNELGSMTRRIHGRAPEIQWQDAIVETIITISIALPVLWMTYRMSRRLFYLEDFLRICSWCKRIGRDGHWVTLEEFIHIRGDVKTTHGICPDCHHKMSDDIKQMTNHTGIVK